MANEKVQRGAPMRMRRRPTALNTERRFGEGLTTVGLENAEQHFAAHRDQRVRKGDIFIRRCLVAFMFALTGVMKTRQYSIEYYASWIATYISVFLIMPSVLPTDNTKIRVMILVTAWNMCCGGALALRFFLRKWMSLDSCDLVRWMCHFNMAFWAAHAALATSMGGKAGYVVLRFTPAQALHSFWHTAGYYFVLVSIVTGVDLAVMTKAGKYDLPQYGVAFYGNALLVLVQFAIGRLCHTPAFKYRMWRYAASVASIRLRNHRRCPSYRLLCWLVPSVTLIFVLAIINTRKGDSSSFARTWLRNKVSQSMPFFQPRVAIQGV